MADSLCVVVIGLIEDVALVVDNLRDEYRIMVTAVVGNGGIGSGKLQEVDIAGAEGQCGLVLERTLDAHLLCHLYDVRRPYFLPQPCRYGVDTLGESTAQGYGVAGEVAVGIRRCPRLHLVGLVVLDLHAEVFVAALVAGRKSLVDGLSVDEELEGGTGLPLSGHLVVVPGVVVDVADPCFHGTGLRLYGHKSAVHEPDHISYGVHRRHVGRDMAFLIVEEPHLVLLVHIVVDAVGLIGVFGLQRFINREPLGYALDEVRDDLSFLVAPWVLMIPVSLESALDDAHLLCHGLLGILLQTCVDGGVDAQSAAVEVVAVEFRLLLEELRHGIAEVLCASRIVVHLLYVEHDALLHQ